MKMMMMIKNNKCDKFYYFLKLILKSFFYKVFNTIMYKELNKNTNNDQLNINELQFEYIINQLIPIIQKRIKEFHKMFSLPLIAEYWEETLSNSFKEIGLENDWTPGRSHKIGEDMKLIDIENSRISCKSGVISDNRELKKECVKWSGSRTTSFETLSDKLEHLSLSHDDWYFLLAKASKFNKKYKLLVFPSYICKPNKLIWNDTKSGKQWHGKGEFLAEISKSMSAQLWTTFPLDKIPYIYEIDCTK